MEVRALISDILKKYYPEYEKTLPLPLELTELCFEYLCEYRIIDKGSSWSGTDCARDRVAEGTFFDEKKHGLWVTIKEKYEYVVGHFVQGKKEGIWVRVDYEDIVTKIGRYVDGERHGEWLYWFDDYFPKQLEYQQFYNHGVPCGEWKEWACNGILTDHETWQTGHLIAAKRWYDDGTPRN